MRHGIELRPACELYKLVKIFIHQVGYIPLGIIKIHKILFILKIMHRAYDHIIGQIREYLLRGRNIVHRLTELHARADEQLPAKRRARLCDIDKRLERHAVIVIPSVSVRLDMVGKSYRPKPRHFGAFAHIHRRMMPVG